MSIITQNEGGSCANAVQTSAGGRGHRETRARTANGFEDDERFLVTTYKDGEFSDTTLSRKEVLRLDFADVDLHIDEVFGRISIQPRRGRRLEYRGEIPGLGPRVGRPFLDELMWQPGEVLTVDELCCNPKLKSLWDCDARAARVIALRKAFRDTPRDG